MANGTWKIARGKGSPQLSIAIVAVLAALLVVLGRAQSSLFDRARTYFSDATAPMLEAALRICHDRGRQRAKIVQEFRKAPHVNCNDGQLGQVFVNLLMNAAQAIEPGRSRSRKRERGSN